MTRFPEGVRHIGVLAVLAFFLLVVGCSGPRRNIKFQFDGQKISFDANGQKCSIQSDDFGFVTDWSDDYSRSSTGTGFLSHDIVVFKGSLNPSKDILFVFNLRNKRLFKVPNVTAFAISESGRWAALGGTPAYGEKLSLAPLIVDGEEVGQIEVKSFCKLKWRKDNLVLIQNLDSGVRQ